MMTWSRNMQQRIAPLRTRSGRFSAWVPMLGLTVLSAVLTDCSRITTEPEHVLSRPILIADTLAVEVGIPIGFRVTFEPDSLEYGEVSCSRGHPVSSFLFDWGDGSSSKTSTDTTSHIWTTEGVREVRVQALCSHDQESAWSRSDTVRIGAPAPPSAAFTVSPEVGEWGTSFHFDATGCRDARDPAPTLQVRWDWENDGAWDVIWSTTHQILHRYDWPGTYTPALQVRDSDGLVDSAVRELEVLPPDWPLFVEHPVTTSFIGAIHADAGDLDGDGDVDFVSAAFWSDHVLWWENDGSAGFVPHELAPSLGGARTVFVVDLDLDSDADILATSGQSEQVLWWENNGTGTFSYHPLTAPLHGADTAMADDLDGDGDLDVMAATWDMNMSGRDSLVIWENDGSQAFSSITLFTDADRIPSLAAADLDGDGDRDIIAAVFGASEIWWFENTGALTFTRHLFAGSVWSCHWIAPGDFDGDGDADIAAASMGGDYVCWFRNDGAVFTRVPVSGLGLFDGASQIEAVDLDGDLDCDLIAVAEAANTVAWWENNGTGAFTRHDITTAYPQPICVTAGDLNGDGHLDLITMGWRGNCISWWERKEWPPNGNREP